MGSRRPTLPSFIVVKSMFNSSKNLPHDSTLKKKLCSKIRCCTVSNTKLTSDKGADKKSQINYRQKDWPLDISVLNATSVEAAMIEMLRNGIEESTDFNSCKRFLSTVIRKPLNILIQLVSIIETPRNLDISINALRSLHKIVLLANFQNKLDSDEIFHIFNNLTALVDSLVTINDIHKADAKFQEIRMEWHVTVFHIVEIFLSTLKCERKNKLKYLKSGTIQFLGNQLGSSHCELITHLLPLLRTVCTIKNNCEIISTRDFYFGLCQAFRFTNKINTITDIFNNMMEIKTNRKQIQQIEEVYSLFIDMIGYCPGKFIATKHKIVDMLYILSSNNDYVTKILKIDEYFEKLLVQFMRPGNTIEYHSQVRALSLLNRSIEHVYLTDGPVDLGFSLPARLITNVNEVESSDDSDVSNNDETKDSQKTDLPVHCVAEPLEKMSPFFLELFNNSSRSTQIDQQGNQLNFSGDVYRLKKINRQSYPDESVTYPISLQEVVTRPKCDSLTTLLSKKLRCLHSGIKNKFLPCVVYDIDFLYKTNAPFQIADPKTPGFVKTVPLNMKNKLVFESRFECGNLRKAIQVEQFEYELFLNPDTYTTKGFQWFYFEVANMMAGVKYTFNIMNFSKSNSSYMEGMHPLMFSFNDYHLFGIGWKRTDGKVMYYNNYYINKSDNVEYRTLSFSVTFQYPLDFVYFAYHYPYTYSRLIRLLKPLNLWNSEKIYVRVDKLCTTINNFNDVPLLTITAKSTLSRNFEVPIKKRPIIFLTGRVHPGESNSSWIMEGIIKFLLDEHDVQAETARKHYIFKIVPMLNPEGVIYGNTRRGLAGIDLNRCWDNPNKEICPEIYHTKRLVAYAKNEIKHPVAAFIDIHGHSNKKFFFLYGCNPKLSWDKKDKKKGDWGNLLTIIPNAIHTINEHMQVSYCNNFIEKQKEGTARVTIWREFNIKHCYTLECTFSEVNNHYAIDTKILVDIGSSLIKAFGNIAKHAFQFRTAVPSLSLSYHESKTRTNKTSKKHA
ncbi:hypothetical protein FQR65_LT17158 [Abscondita terminalis]|nr:hypothetical protein FQR65_LT17158 [Abscondita terminalis]